jgi:uncharacterized protein
MERLTIPFAAISAFTDPSVNFGLQFHVSASLSPEETEPALPASAAALPDGENQQEQRPAAEIVTLDRFRKR